MTPPTTTRRPYVRPTKADMQAAVDRADQAVAEADALRARLQLAEFDRDSWRAERLEVPEAETLARCIRAIDTLLFDDRDSPGPTVSTSGVVSAAPFHFCVLDETAGGADADEPPTRQYVEAEESPVGRVLLHLAARYGISLWGER